MQAVASLKSILRIALLKIASDEDSLTFLDSFVRRYGPKYLIKHFPDLTVLKCGNWKSEFS